MKNETEKIAARQKLDAIIFARAVEVEKTYQYFIELKENLFRIENIREKKNETSQIEKNFRANAHELNKLNEELETVADSLAKNLSVQKQANKSLLKLENNSVVAKTRFDEIQRKVDDIERIEILESQIDTAIENLNLVQEELAETNQKRGALEKQIDEVTIEKDKIDNLLQETKTDFQIWLDRLENRRKVVDKDECPTCGNELKREETRQRLIVEFEEAEQKIDELGQKKAELSENFTGAKNRLLTSSGNQKTSNREHQRLLQTDTEFKTKIEIWQSQITVSYETVEREVIRRNFAEIQKQIAGAEGQYKTEKVNFDLIGNTVGDLEKSKTRIETDIENTQKNLKRLEERILTAQTSLINAENQISGNWQIHTALQDETELENLRREKDNLQNIESEHKILSEARNRQIILETQIETLTKQLEEIPEINRRGVPQVQTELDEISEKTETNKANLKDAENICRRISEDKKRFDEKSIELKFVKEDFEIWKKLAKALGR